MNARFVFSALEATHREPGSLLATLIDFGAVFEPEFLAERADFLDRCAAYLSVSCQTEHSRLLADNAWLLRLYSAGEATLEDLSKESERIYFEAQMVAIGEAAIRD